MAGKSVQVLWIRFISSLVTSFSTTASTGFGSGFLCASRTNMMEAGMWDCCCTEEKEAGGAWNRILLMINMRRGGSVLEWKRVQPDEVWRRGRAAEEALSSPGSVQTRWWAARAAAAAARCTTEALSSGSTSQIPPTLWDTSTPGS